MGGRWGGKNEFWLSVFFTPPSSSQCELLWVWSREEGGKKQSISLCDWSSCRPLFDQLKLLVWPNVYGLSEDHWWLPAYPLRTDWLRPLADAALLAFPHTWVTFTPYTASILGQLWLPNSCVLSRLPGMRGLPHPYFKDRGSHFT